MDKIIDIFIDCFEWKLSPSYKNLISFLAYTWMRGAPLGELLENRINYVRKNSSNEDVSSVIRNYLNVLDHDIRFKLVKYFSAFNDILKYVLIQRDFNMNEIAIEPYHIYLEFGSCKKEALNIMAMGLSRFTALHLATSINVLPEMPDIDDYYNEIMSIDVKKLRMPSLCKQEILNIQGKSLQLYDTNK
jgi:hypothetical protein